MKQLLKKTGITLLSAAVGVGLMLPNAGMLVHQAQAADADELPDIQRQELSRSKTATPLDKDKVTDVTISVPAAETVANHAYDIVFVVDCSSVLRENAQGIFNAVDTMITRLEEKGNTADIKVGMVGFNNSAVDIFDLKSIDDIQKDDNAFLDEQKARFDKAKAFYKYHQNKSRSLADCSGYGDLAPWVAFGSAASDYDANAMKNAANDDAYTNAMQSFYKRWPENNPKNNRVPTGEGTNLQAGLQAGKAMLDKGASHDDCKYVIVVSDGATFYYNHDGRTSVSPVEYNAHTTLLVGNQDASDPAATPKRVNKTAFSSYAGLAADQNAVNTFIDTTGAKGGDTDGAKAFAGFIKEHSSKIMNDPALGYSYTKSEFNELVSSSQDYVIETAGEFQLQDPSVQWPSGPSKGSGIGATSYHTEHNDDSATEKAARKLGSIDEEDFASSNYPYTNMERGTYFAAREMIEMRNAGYNFVTVGFNYGCDNLSGKPALQRAVAGSFVGWTSNVGELFHSPNDAESADHPFAEQLQAATDHIFFPIKKGSVLYDEMGNEDGKYTYDLVTPSDSMSAADCFKAVIPAVDGKTETLSVAAGSNANEWVFSNAAGMKVATLTYYPEGTKDGDRSYGKCYKLEVHEELQGFTLTYKEKLTLDNAYVEQLKKEAKAANPDAKTVTVETKANNSAEMTRENYPTEEFPEPELDDEITIDDEETPLATTDSADTSSDPDSGDDADGEDEDEDADDESSSKKTSSNVKTGDEGIAWGALLAAAAAATALGTGALAARRKEL